MPRRDSCRQRRAWFKSHTGSIRQKRSVRAGRSISVLPCPGPAHYRNTDELLSRQKTAVCCHIICIGDLSFQWKFIRVVVYKTRDPWPHNSSGRGLLYHRLDSDDTRYPEKIKTSTKEVSVFFKNVFSKITEALSFPTRSW